MSNSNSFLKNVERGVKKRMLKSFSNKYSALNISWLYRKYLKHASQGKLLTHKLFNNATSFYNAQEYLHGIDEIFIEEVYKQQLPENAVVVDCGAHIGLSIIYIKSICPTAYVTAFEPDKKNFELLQSNITNHKLQNVELINKAVWKETTTLSFHSGDGMSSKIVEGVSDEHKIEAVRLNDYLNKKIDFLKIDIEGAEYEVLKDIDDNLKNVQNLFLEYHGSFAQNVELCDMLNIVVKNGFKYYIKEASVVYENPFLRNQQKVADYDLQLNIFCFRN